MTSEEIRDSINRLRVLVDKDIAVVLTGEYGWADTKLRAYLIELLEQADPYTHMELPRDADDMPIHIGDEMEGAVAITNGQRATVYGFELNAKGEWEWISDHQVRHKCKWWRHYRKPAIEDMLREFAAEWFDVDDDTNLVAEYADRLKELIQDER